MEKLKSLLGKVPTGILSGLTVIIILWLTLAPHPTGDMKVELFEGADKVVHAIMFGFLAFVVLLEMMKHRRWTPLPLPLIGLVAFICSGFGIGIEFLQNAMGLGRELEILDMLADGAGAMVGAAVWAAVQGLLADKDN